ncbi:unnamed protein product [Arctogadus glacialis]
MGWEGLRGGRIIGYIKQGDGGQECGEEEKNKYTKKGMSDGGAPVQTLGHKGPGAAAWLPPYDRQSPPREEPARWHTTAYKRKVEREPSTPVPPQPPSRDVRRPSAGRCHWDVAAVCACPARGGGAPECYPPPHTGPLPRWSGSVIDGNSLTLC